MTRAFADVVVVLIWPNIFVRCDWHGQMRKLVAALLALSLISGSAPALANVTGSEPPPSGGGLYMRNCARCHGRSGHGDGPEMAEIGRRLHSLADCDWMALMSDATLFLLIDHGSAAAGFPAGMPGFGGQLDSEQIMRLIGHIRSFCAAKEARPRGAWAPPPGDLPRLSTNRMAFSANIRRVVYLRACVWNTICVPVPKKAERDRKAGEIE